MKTIPKQLVACTGIAALSAVGLFAAVTNTPKSVTPHHGLLSELETVLVMTPAQRTQAESAFHEARQSVQPVRQQLRQTRTDLQAAIRSDDTAQIQRLSTAEGQEIGQLTAIQSLAFAKVYNTLTPAQRERAVALRQMMMRAMRAR